MAVEAGEIVEKVLELLVGVDWPEGDEDKCEALGKAWEHAATELGKVAGDLAAAVNKLNAANEGKGMEAFLRMWDKLSKGEKAFFPALEAASKALGGAADDTSDTIYATKIEFVTMATIQGAAILAQIAAAPITLGITAGTAAASTAALRFSFMQVLRRMLGRIEASMVRRLLKNVALEALSEVRDDIISQFIHMTWGSQDGYSIKQTALAAGGGAAGGLAAIGVNGLGKKVFGEGAESGIRGVTTSLASNVSAEVAGTVATGGPVNWETFASGGLGGATDHAASKAGDRVSNAFDVPNIGTPNLGAGGNLGGNRIDSTLNPDRGGSGNGGGNAGSSGGSNGSNGSGGSHNSNGSNGSNGSTGSNGSNGGPGGNQSGGSPHSNSGNSGGNSGGHSGGDSANSGGNSGNSVGNSGNTGNTGGNSGGDHRPAHAPVATQSASTAPPPTADASTAPSAPAPGAPAHNGGPTQNTTTYVQAPPPGGGPGGVPAGGSPAASGSPHGGGGVQTANAATGAPAATGPSSAGSTSGSGPSPSGPGSAATNVSATTTAAVTGTAAAGAGNSHPGAGSATTGNSGAGNGSTAANNAASGPTATRPAGASTNSVPGQGTSPNHNASSSGSPDTTNRIPGQRTEGSRTPDRPNTSPDTTPHTDHRPDSATDPTSDRTTDPKPDTRPDTHTEPGPDPTTDARPDSDARPDTTPETRPDSTPDTSPDTRPDPTGDATPDSRPDPTSGTTPDARPDPTGNTTPDTRPDPGGDVTPDGRPDATPDTRPDPAGEPVRDGSPDPDGEAAPGARPDATPDSQRGTDLSADPSADAYTGDASPRPARDASPTRDDSDGGVTVLHLPPVGPQRGTSIIPAPAGRFGDALDGLGNRVRNLFGRGPDASPNVAPDTDPTTDPGPNPGPFRLSSDSGTTYDSTPYGNSRPASTRPDSPQNPAGPLADRPPLNDGRPLYETGGLMPPSARDRSALVDAVPRTSDGAPVVHPDPRVDGWLPLQNDGGIDVPGRANNCMDGVLAFGNTWFGRPEVAAPRIPGENGGETRAPERAQREIGGNWTPLGRRPDGSTDIAGAYGEIEARLRDAGPGALTYIVTSRPTEPRIQPDGTIETGRVSHAWAAVNVDGDVLWVDPQSGEVMPEPYPGQNRVWALPVDANAQPIDMSVPATTHPADPTPDPTGQPNPARPAADSTTPTTPDHHTDTPDTTPEPSADTTPKSPRTEPNPTTDSTPDARPDSTPDARPKQETDTDSDVAPDTHPDAEPDTAPDTRPDAKPDPTSEVTPDSDPRQDTTPDPSPDRTPDRHSETAPTGDGAPTPDTNTDPTSDRDATPTPDPATEPDPASHPAPDATPAPVRDGSGDTTVDATPQPGGPLTTTPPRAPVRPDHTGPFRNTLQSLGDRMRGLLGRGPDIDTGPNHPGPAAPPFQGGPFHQNPNTPSPYNGTPYGNTPVANNPYAQPMPHHAPPPRPGGPMAGRPPLSAGRPFNQPGGLLPPTWSDVSALNNAVPRHPDGTPVVHPDPRQGRWFRLQNDGGHQVPGRGINCLDGVLAFGNTWFGRPEVSAARVPGENGGETNGMRRAEQETGAPWNRLDLNPDGSSSPGAAFARIDAALRTSGPGSISYIVTEWPPRNEVQPDGSVRVARSSHAWAAINVGGDILWIDPQTNQIMNLPHPNAITVSAITLDPNARPVPMTAPPVTQPVAPPPPPVPPAPHFQTMQPGPYAHQQQPPPPAPFTHEPVVQPNPYTRQQQPGPYNQPGPHTQQPVQASPYTQQPPVQPVPHNQQPIQPGPVHPTPPHNQQPFQTGPVHPAPPHNQQPVQPGPVHPAPHHPQPFRTGPVHPAPPHNQQPFQTGPVHPAPHNQQPVQTGPVDPGSHVPNPGQSGPNPNPNPNPTPAPTPATPPPPPRHTQANPPGPIDTTPPLAPPMQANPRPLGEPATTASPTGDRPTTHDGRRDDIEREVGDFMATRPAAENFDPNAAPNANSPSSPITSPAPNPNPPKPDDVRGGQSPYDLGVTRDPSFMADRANLTWDTHRGDAEFEMPQSARSNNPHPDTGAPPRNNLNRATIRRMFDASGIDALVNHPNPDELTSAERQARDEFDRLLRGTDARLLTGSDLAQRMNDLALRGRDMTGAPRYPINSGYAGQIVHFASPTLDNHFPDGVYINLQGYPDFTTYAVRTINLPHTVVAPPKRSDFPPGPDGTKKFKEARQEANDDQRKLDIRQANAEFRNDPMWAGVRPGRSAPGYVWHHVEGTRTMMLIPFAVHYAVKHHGGIASAMAPDPASGNPGVQP
ncbi:toxin glutamine deamidase domain-containing protein [Embleya sp. NPDC020630]|uniref:toxin glutamine deamidase domain-containing protein n=1 Tax=Embleya sp. NPDC020630 TaxID=3363979 RepID=UPI00378D3925